MNSHQLDGYIDKRMPSNQLPILLFLAGQDVIIDNDGVLKVLLKGDQLVLDVHVYGDQTHSIQFDAPQRMVEDMDRWLVERIGDAAAE